MPLKNGDFILIEFTAKIKETGEIFDTTNEEIAKKERLYKEGEIYEPKLVVVGEGWVLKALDEALSTLQLDKRKTIEIPQDKAFGPRDAEKLKMVPLRRLQDKGITPQIGKRIEYDKKLAIIRTVGAGRVTLDFNPPLAGKTLLYEILIKKKLISPKDKMTALVHRRVPMADITKFQLDIAKTQTVIHVPEEAFYIEGIQLAKRGIASDIQRFFPKTAKLDFVETFRNPQAASITPEEKSTKKKQRIRDKKKKATKR